MPSSIRPINNNLRGIGSLNNKPKSAFESLDIDRIGQGRLMTEGSYSKQLGLKKHSGLKGQLMKMKWAGRRGVTKNLSTGNIKQIHGLIADRIKNKTLGSNTIISRRDKLAIMKEARKLVRSGARSEGSKFTWQDRKDLKRTVDVLQKQYKDKIFHRENGADGLSQVDKSQFALNNQGIIPKNELLRKIGENSALPSQSAGAPRINKLPESKPDPKIFIND
ncbi:hypothetical protein KKH38_00070 [Patescibacteria group bacterium]|nr:hypothetical protein [Patescibacteria group bacterium]MBU4601291.1 hypothetical protein [Patescibacteria group bacterium]